MNKTPLNSCVCGTPGTIWAPLGAQYRAPLVKSEFFFLCIFSISLRRRELSESHSYFTMPDSRAIYSSERFSRNVLSSAKKWLVTLRHVTSRHVTSRFVTVNLFSNKRTPNGYCVPQWVNLFINNRKPYGYYVPPWVNLHLLSWCSRSAVLPNKLTDL